jgi:DNA-directed RNA polymerase sigma subunit (sigma70/sigma32)
MLTPEEETEAETLKAQMKEVINECCRTPIERATIKKRYLEGKTWVKIANELIDLSEDATRKRAYRTLDRLRH